MQSHSLKIQIKKKKERDCSQISLYVPQNILSILMTIYSQRKTIQKDGKAKEYMTSNIIN